MEDDMPSYKWTGSNEGGFVTLGGKRFDKDQPVDVDDPSLVAKLEGNGEFERVGGPSDTEAPVWSPPGPTGIGTGPGSGPYQTTNEVIDSNPNPDAGKPTEEELEEQQEAAEEATDEGPKRKGKKPSPDQA
jgi:hypothetical protein